MGHKIEELTAEGIKKKLDEVREKEELKFRVFISNSFPALSDSPTIFSRMCLYCDSLDGDFLIDHDPDHPGLFVVSSRSALQHNTHTHTHHLQQTGKRRLRTWIQVRASFRHLDC